MATGARRVCRPAVAALAVAALAALLPAGAAAQTNRPPTVQNAIPDQSATVGTAFSYAFPANTFADADNHTLTYSATETGESGLPTWLSFTAGTRTFSGTPTAGDVGRLSVTVTASDGNGGSARDTFHITVACPAADHPASAFWTACLTLGHVEQGGPFDFSGFHSHQPFGSASETAFTYRGAGYEVQRVYREHNRQRLTLDLDSDTRAVSEGWVLRVGAVDLAVADIADYVTTHDQYRWANHGITWGSGNVGDVVAVSLRRRPTLASGIPDRAATAGRAFAFTVAAGTFADDNQLSYTAELDGGGALPAWLCFTPRRRSFTGIPGEGDVGTLSVKVTASDGADSVSDTFDIVVAAPPTPLVDPVAPQRCPPASQGSSFLALRSSSARWAADPTFATSAALLAAARAADVAVDASGRAVVVGAATDAGGAPSGAVVVRYSRAGELDGSFGDGGIVRLGAAEGVGELTAVALQTTGGERVVLAGRTPRGPGGDSDLLVLALRPDGTLDESFGDRGLAAIDIAGGDDRLKDLTLDTEGRIIAAGATVAPGADTGDALPVDGGPVRDPAAGGASDFVVVRLSADGSPDGAFGTGGVVVTDIGGDDAAAAVAAYADGRLVAAGASGGAVAVARYLPDGSPDAGFGVGGVVTDATWPGGGARGVAIGTHGKVVLVGETPEGVVLGRLRLWGRRHAGGVWDPGFGDRREQPGLFDARSGWAQATLRSPGSAHPGGAPALAAGDDGTLWVAATGTGETGDTDPVLLRYSPDGAPDEDFGDAGRLHSPGGDDVAAAIAVAADGAVVVAGHSRAGDRDRLLVLRYGRIETEPPGAPRNIGHGVHADRVELRWLTPYRGPVRAYRILRRDLTAGETALAPHAEIPAGTHADTVHRWTDPTAGAGHTYQYAVVAVNAAGPSEPTPTLTAHTRQPRTPTPPAENPSRVTLGTLIGHRTLTVGDPATRIGLTEAFAGTATTYTARAAHPHITHAAITGTTLALVALAPGTTTITVTATNPTSTALQEFTTTNTPPPPPR